MKKTILMILLVNLTVSIYSQKGPSTRAIEINKQKQDSINKNNTFLIPFLEASDSEVEVKGIFKIGKDGNIKGKAIVTKSGRVKLVGKSSYPPPAEIVIDNDGNQLYYGIAQIGDTITPASNILYRNTIHEFHGKHNLRGYIFESTSETQPLKFQVTKDKGYVYISGKGTVTMPNGVIRVFK
jgi:hypothetical protein